MVWEINTFEQNWTDEAHQVKIVDYTYKLERILMQQVELKSSLNSKEFFFIKFFI